MVLAGCRCSTCGIQTQLKLCKKLKYIESSENKVCPCFSLFSFRMQYLTTFSAIADAMDLTPNILVKFHLPHETILEYTALVKEFYKKLLYTHTNSTSDTIVLQPLFQQVYLLLRVLLSAGGDTIITPRVSEYGKAVEEVFEDIIIENNLQQLLKQIVWIVRRIGKTFQITNMESLKIDSI